MTVQEKVTDLSYDLMNYINDTLTEKVGTFKCSQVKKDFLFMYLKDVVQEAVVENTQIKE